MSDKAIADRAAVLSLSSSVAIANGATVSSAADLVGHTLCGFSIPSAFTGTAITFQASLDGTTYQQLYNGGSAYSVTVAADKYVTVDPSVFAGVRYVKLVSGSAEGGARTITLAKRPV